MNDLIRRISTLCILDGQSLKTCYGYDFNNRNIFCQGKITERVFLNKTENLYISPCERHLPGFVSGSVFGIHEEHEEVTDALV